MQTALQGTSVAAYSGPPTRRWDATNVAQRRAVRQSDLRKTDDTALIARAVEGDREAFGALYERYAFKVFRRVYCLTSDTHTAEDLTAQTFVNALEAIHRYEGRGVPFLAWLLRIAYNLTVSYRRVRRNGTAPLSEAVEVQGGMRSPEESCEARADAERVREVVQELTADQRRVIAMRFVEGRSFLEIAEMLGKSAGALRVTQYRALRALRRRLEAESSEHPRESGRRTIAG
jgi:RNA polymerase sigma-70 factor (ECF subfamily)